MNASEFRFAFLALFGLGLIIEWILNYLNQKEVRRHLTLPAAFTGHFDPETFSKSKAYTLDRISFDNLSLLYTSILTMFILFSGILPWVDAKLANHFGGGLNRGALFLAGVMMVQTVTR